MGHWFISTLKLDVEYDVVNVLVPGQRCDVQPNITLTGALQYVFAIGIEDSQVVLGSVVTQLHSNSTSPGWGAIENSLL